MKEMLKRAGRTFIQAIVGFTAANLAAYFTGITDSEMLYNAIIAFAASALAAGLAAVMNMPKKDKGANTNG